MQLGCLATALLRTSDSVRSCKMEIITDELTGIETVFITNEDGTTLSMLKSTYDALEEQTNDQSL